MTGSTTASWPKLVVGCALIAAVGLGSTSASATEYFIGPQGDDSNPGIQAANPLATFDKAVSKLTPGDTLTLKNGTYAKSTTGYPYIRCGHTAKNGTADQPITIRARNERRAHIDGDGSQAALSLLDCSYWNVAGIHASSSNNQGGATEVFKLARVDHINLKRLLANHDNRYENSSMVGIVQGHHVVAEEIEIYDFHRHGFSAYQSDHITLRRSFIHARGASDIDGGWGSHRCCKDGGDEGVSFYYTSNSIMENVITVDSEGLSVISGLDTVLGNRGGRNNKILGSVSYNDLRPSFFQSRNKKPNSRSAKHMTIKNYLVVGAQRESMTPRGVQDFTLANTTFYNSEVTPLYLLASGSGQLVGGKHYFPGCEYWTCQNEVRNTLFLGVPSPVVDSSLPSTPSNLQWQVNHSNAWTSGSPNPGFGTSGNVGNARGHYQMSTEQQPSMMGLGQGECLVYVPDSSNMKHAGKNGADIGANILYRYEDGQLTDQPLWDPDTGEFPCGAVVPGVNDVAGKSCFDIHKQLNANQHGCQLPYEPAIPAKDIVLQAPRSNAAVVIDGEMSEEVYAKVQAFDDARANSDNTTRLWSGWDDQWLYVGAEVDDASVDVDPTANPWTNDSIELFIDPNRDRSDALMADDLKPLILADGTANLAETVDERWSGLPIGNAMKSAVTTSGTGFRVEVAVKWQTLGVQPSAGTQLGLLAVNNDRDGDQVTRYAFNDTVPSSVPSNWGTLKLMPAEPTGGGDTGTADAGPRFDDTSSQSDSGANTDTARPDGGSGVADTGQSDTTGAGRSESDDAELSNDGCGCSAAHPASLPASWCGLLLLVGAIGQRRRRRSIE